MTRSINTRRTQHNLYLLRRQYGGPVTVYHQVSAQSADPTTGRRKPTVNAYDVKRAVILPGKRSLQQIRGISLISANKQLVQGGEYEADLEVFIIDSRDVPFEPTTDDWLVHKDRKYNFAVVDRYEDSSSWLIAARALAGRAPNQIFNVRAEELLSLTDAVENDDG